MTDKINTGGPAYPLVVEYMEYNESGMTLRDYFAGQAVGEVIAYFADKHPIRNEPAPVAFARKAYEIADAMIAAREPKP